MTQYINARWLLGLFFLCIYEPTVKALSEADIRGATSQQVESALASIDRQIAESKGALRVLLPKTSYLTDLYELYRDYPYGFLDPEIDGMARAQCEFLTKTSKIYGEGYDKTQAEKLSKQCDEKMEALTKEANLWAARKNELATKQTPQRQTASGGQSDMFIPVKSNMPSIEERKANVRMGRVPLTSTELSRFLRGEAPSSMASSSESKAWVMAEVMVGRRPADDMPEEYGGMPKGNSRRAILARREWQRNRAYSSAAAAGPAAAQQFLMNEKTQQSLQNIQFQQMQIQQQLHDMKWQAQTQRNEQLIRGR